MTRLALMLTCAAMVCAGETPIERYGRELDDIGRVATVMVDGDVCKRILTPRALEFLLRNSSRDKWADADNYDVNDAAFTATKKTLIRLSKLATYPVDVNLWMPLTPDRSTVHVVIRNRHEMSQFWQWGQLRQPVPEPMRSVLDTGGRATVTQRAGFVSVLAPVLDSLGDIVGLVEVVTRINPDPRENVK